MPKYSAKIRPLTQTEDTQPKASRIAVAIPCFNEAAAIAIVIERLRAVLPSAELVVFDNNSTDGTGSIARELGVRVVDVPSQGKGYVVRAAFAALGDADVVVLTDGDGTYPAEAAPGLIAGILEQGFDMSVGARRPEAGAGAMTVTRGVGNFLIRTAFRILIGPGNTDLLSGYRAFSRRFRETVQLRASGFEIETELASEAVARRLRIVEIPTLYHPRIAGTVSKLRSFRDGLRILATIVSQSCRYRIHRALAVFVLPLVVAALLVHPGFWVALAVSMLIVFGLLVIDRRSRPGRSGAP